MYALCFMPKRTPSTLFQNASILMFSAGLGNRLIVILGCQEVCCSCNANTIEQQHDPADGAQNPGFVQCPADEEAVVVVVEVGLK
jgi:hypothetical protein